eukprot:592100_1
MNFPNQEEEPIQEFMMRDFETYVGPDFIQPGEERLLRSYQPAQPRVNRQPETEVLVAVKEIGKPLKIVQPGTAYLGRNAVHKLQQGDCCGGGGPAKADDADVQALGETIKAKEKEIERLKNDANQEKVKTDVEIQDLKKDISTKEEEIDGLKTGPTQEKVKTDAKIQALEETIKAKEKEIQVLKTGVTQEKTNTDVKIQKLEKTIEAKTPKSRNWTIPSRTSKSKLIVVRAKLICWRSILCPRFHWKWVPRSHIWMLARTCRRLICWTAWLLKSGRIRRIRLS